MNKIGLCALGDKIVYNKVDNNVTIQSGKYWHDIDDN
nr:MAG TPA: hypothetical protein [Caudoviricetes sp.]